MGNMHQPKMHTANAQHSELNMAWNKLQMLTGVRRRKKTKRHYASAENLSESENSFSLTRHPINEQELKKIVGES